MTRDFIMIVGNQGFGKSVWRKLYTRSKPRLLEYDPMAADPSTDFVSDPSIWVPKIESREITQFRYGTYFQDELCLFGSLAFSTGDCCFVMEECGTYFRKGAPLEKWAGDLVFMGRHPRVDFLLIAQRASSIPIDIRSQVQRIVTFRQTEPDDVDALAERLGPGLEDEITNLPQLHCIDRDLITGDISRYSITPT